MNGESKELKINLSSIVMIGEVLLLAGIVAGGFKSFFQLEANITAQTLEIHNMKVINDIEHRNLQDQFLTHTKLDGHKPILHELSDLKNRVVRIESSQ